MQERGEGCGQACGQSEGGETAEDTWEENVCKQMLRGKRRTPQGLFPALGSHLPGTFSVDSL